MEAWVGTSEEATYDFGAPISISVMWLMLTSLWEHGWEYVWRGNPRLWRTDLHIGNGAYVDVPMGAWVGEATHDFGIPISMVVAWLKLMSLREHV